MSAPDASKKYFVQSQTDSDDEGDALYFEMPYDIDHGFWHDTALQILKRANFEPLREAQQNEFKKFVFALANHVFNFRVYGNTHNIKYEYHARNHKLLHDGEKFHVITRIESDKLLIFVCTNDGKSPNSCFQSNRKKALGLDSDKNADTDHAKTSPTPAANSKHASSKVTVHREQWSKKDAVGRFVNEDGLGRLSRLPPESHMPQRRLQSDDRDVAAAAAHRRQEAQNQRGVPKKQHAEV